ncbi:MAG: stage II sporulation protein M [Candidatus Pacearchaeota archaeon]|nr:stage II sporulation protein M [Candidatus Pacearchaeota archaeon]MDE1848488.1 stage II sporulation protein M [Nanoarchaeota archaeon]
MARKKEFSVKEQYLKSWKYIKESRGFIFAAIALFFVFALAGFFLPSPNYISQEIEGYISQLISQTSGMSGPQLVSFILLNNIKSSFFGLALGIFLGIFPAILAIFNGYLLGFVAVDSVKSNGALILLRLLPHGIFELPAVFVSLGMGMKLGVMMFSRKKEHAGKNVINALRVFVFVVIPLLIIAAIIEGSLIVLIK